MGDMIPPLGGHLVPFPAPAHRRCAMICPMDATDRKMLAVLQEEGRISNAALAERLHLSPSPCLRRLRALEQDGVIAGYRAVLDRQKVGIPMTVFVELKV